MLEKVAPYSECHKFTRASQWVLATWVTWLTAGVLRLAAKEAGGGAGDASASAGAPGASGAAASSTPATESGQGAAPPAGDAAEGTASADKPKKRKRETLAIHKNMALQFTFVPLASDRCAPSCVRVAVGCVSQPWAPC